MRSLVILAGGKSSRMGRDKVMIKMNGMAFVELIYQKAQKCFDRIIISTDSKEHAEQIKELPLFMQMGNEPEFAIDNYDAAGPIGGVLSVFEQTDVKRFAIISVDVPLCSIETLVEIYDQCDKAACFLKIGEKRAEPLIAAYDRKAFPLMKESFQKGMFKMRLAVGDENVRIITTEEIILKNKSLAGVDFEKVFDNFNTPEELSKIINI